MSANALLRVAARSGRWAVVQPRVARSALYSTTSMRFRKKVDPEDAFQIEYEKLTLDPIQTMNTDMSDEEAMKILEEELALIKEAEDSKFLGGEWKPGQRKRPLVSAKTLEEFDEELTGKILWTLRDKRCGALGIKLGMLPIWDGWGQRHPCTVLFLDSNIVTAHKTLDHHGYLAVQIGAGERKKKNAKATVLGQYKDIPQVQEHPPYIIREFRVTDPAFLPDIGTQIHARHFVPGQQVDIAGITKGKGFQGGMKRWNFSGMGASHGVSKTHRAIGSTGQCQDPGKVFKGKKMPGQMGNDRVTVQNLRVLKIDRGRNLLYIRGAIPGNRGEFVEIRDAVKKPLWGTEKLLDALDRPPVPTFEYDPEQDGCGLQGYEQFMPLPGEDPLAPMEQEA
jgi:large subunit ribosomal protein L3